MGILIVVASIELRPIVKSIRSNSASLVSEILRGAEVNIF